MAMCESAEADPAVRTRVPTTISDITNNLATLDTVTGATSYHVQYIPEITVYATLTENYTSESDRYSWSIDCIEV